MTLKFTNRSVRRLFESTGIDLLNFTGEALKSLDSRMDITLAGVSPAEEDATREACEDLTPGEHIELLTEAIRRDLVPQSIREAMAKAAPDDKSAA